LADIDIESPLKVHLFQGISRSERMDFTIQKAVELGVSEITPVFTHRSILKKIDQKRLLKKQQHWQNIALSACEQSCRTALVKVNPPIQVKQIADYSAEIQLLLSPHAEHSLSQLNHLKPQTINILIGPEGGLNESEVDLAMDNNYQAITLGPRILRTETAGISTLSVLQYMWGDLG